jgi:hypothetical protein
MDIFGKRSSYHVKKNGSDDLDDELHIEPGGNDFGDEHLALDRSQSPDEADEDSAH